MINEQEFVASVNELAHDPRRAWDALDDIEEELAQQEGAAFTDVEIPVFEDLKSFEQFFWKKTSITFCDFRPEIRIVPSPRGIVHVGSSTCLDELPECFSDESRAIWSHLDGERGFPFFYRDEYQLLLNDLDLAQQREAQIDVTSMSNLDRSVHEELSADLNEIVPKAKEAIEAGYADAMVVWWG